MAKGARASSKKSNNARLKSKVFGPVEDARVQRLSAKLLELAQQPRPKPEVEKGSEDINMDVEEVDPASNSIDLAGKNEKGDNTPMDLDDKQAPVTVRVKVGKGRVEKRAKSRRKASIVFPKYKKIARKSSTLKK